MITLFIKFKFKEKQKGEATATLDAPVVFHLILITNEVSSGLSLSEIFGQQ